MPGKGKKKGGKQKVLKHQLISEGCHRRDMPPTSRVGVVLCFEPPYVRGWQLWWFKVFDCACELVAAAYGERLPVRVLMPPLRGRHVRQRNRGGKRTMHGGGARTAAALGGPEGREPIGTRTGKL